MKAEAGCEIGVPVRVLESRVWEFSMWWTRFEFDLPKVSRVVLGRAISSVLAPQVRERMVSARAL
jgi:hypothetical protein